MSLAVIITTPNTDVFKQALAIGFDIVGSWPAQGPGPIGSPAASTHVALRREVTQHYEGTWDFREGHYPPTELFEHYGGGKPDGRPTFEQEWAKIMGPAVGAARAHLVGTTLRGALTAKAILDEACEKTYALELSYTNPPKKEEA